MMFADIIALMRAWLHSKKKQRNIEDKNKLLLVEDDVILLDMIKSFLENDNLVVKTAHNGEEALTLFKTESFDLVISDIKMPRMDGIQLLAQLSQHDTTINVIMLTAYDDSESYFAAMKLGAAEYIPKPISLYKLRNIVNKYVNHHRRYNLQRMRSKLRFFLSSVMRRWS